MKSIERSLLVNMVFLLKMTEGESEDLLEYEDSGPQYFGASFDGRSISFQLPKSWERRLPEDHSLDNAPVMILKRGDGELGSGDHITVISDWESSTEKCISIDVFKHWMLQEANVFKMSLHLEEKYGVKILVQS